ncbi:MAG: ABC transporter permease [Spirochaetaceae bacterium]|jgi:peptide/nickel transport system permease protein|nr:ABC transporter permease [Spirochaetaceae bacterium]
MKIRLFSKKNRLLAAGSVMVGILIGVALMSGYLEPNDPAKIILAHKNQFSSVLYPLGTDSMGRCVLSRILEGAKSSLGVAFLAVGVSAATGCLIGILSGYAGGFIDGIVMRITDIFLSFPSIILALTVLAIAGPGFFNVVCSLSAVGWTHFARLTRGVTLSVKNSELIQAAKAIGNNSFQIIVSYIIPQIAPKVIILIPLDLSKTIMSSAALSFLGLGIQPPTAEWGSMLNEARQFIRSSPHEIIFPSLALFLSAFSFNVLGEGIRAKLDPYIAE